MALVIKQYPCDKDGFVTGDLIKEYKNYSKATHATGISETSIIRCSDPKHPHKKCTSKDDIHKYYRFFDTSKENLLNDKERIERYTKVKTIDPKTGETIETRYDNPLLLQKKITKEDIEKYYKDVFKICSQNGGFKKIKKIKIKSVNKALLLIDSDRHNGSDLECLDRYQNYINWALDLIKNGNYSEIVYVKLGDFWQSDTLDGKTTKWTQVDSPRLKENTKVIDKIIPLEIKFYEEIAKYAPLKIYNSKGNHDLRTSELTHRVLSWRFENNSNITFDMSTNEYKKWNWGKYNHYFSHGDWTGNRQADVIAHFNKELEDKNGRTILHTGHKHKFQTKNLSSGTWYQHPTSSPKNDFEDKLGYLDDDRYNVAMEIDKNKGETNRYIHFIGKE